MDILNLLKILINPNICDFLCKYCATNLLNYNIKGIVKHLKNKNDTIEAQIVNALIDSYNNLCYNLKIECDHELITEIFIHFIYKHKDNLTIQCLKNIIKETLKYVDPYIASCYDISEMWENELVYIISLKYHVLKDYLILNKIWYDYTYLSDIKSSTDYLIENMKTQHEIIEQLCQKLNNVEIQNIYIVLEDFVRKQISLALEDI